MSGACPRAARGTSVLVEVGQGQRRYDSALRLRVSRSRPGRSAAAGHGRSDAARKIARGSARPPGLVHVVPPTPQDAAVKNRRGIAHPLRQYIHRSKSLTRLEKSDH